MVANDHCGSLVVADKHWWSLMITDDCRWSLVVANDCWRSLVVTNNRWLLLVADDHQSLMVTVDRWSQMITGGYWCLLIIAWWSLLTTGVHWWQLGVTGLDTTQSFLKSSKRKSNIWSDIRIIKHSVYSLKNWIIVTKSTRIDTKRKNFQTFLV